MAQRPEITFGSNVAVWRNEQGRTVTITPRRYKDKDGEWRDASGWNVSDLVHLAHCLTLAATHCLSQRAKEDGREGAPKHQNAPPDVDTSNLF